MQIPQNIKAGRGAKTSAKDPSATAFTFLLVYFFIEYVRPQDRLPGIGALKIGLLVTIACAALWIAKGDKAPLKDPLIRWYIAFTVLAGMSLLFSVNTYWAFQCTKTVGLMLLAATLPSASLLADPDRLHKFVYAWIGFHAFVALTSFAAGGRGPGAFLGDENDLALALNMAVPYAYFMSTSPLATARARWLCRLATLVLVIASVFTWSRGGFLGMIAVMGMIWLMSPGKIKNAAIILVLGIVTIVGIPLFTEKGSVLDEFSTIEDPNDSTRRDRLDSWGTGWDMYVDNPVFGVGAGNYAWRVGEYQMKDPNFDPRRRRGRAGRAAHSLYFTLLPEMGTAGTVCFVAMAWLIVKRGRQVQKLKPKDEALGPRLVEVQLVGKAIIASLIAFLVSGTFVSVLWYPHLFYLVGFAIAALAAGKSLATETSVAKVRRTSVSPRARLRQPSASDPS